MPRRSPRKRADQSPPEGDDELLFRLAPVGLGVADLDGTLLAFNDAILQPGGYTRDDMAAIGNVARLYCHDDDRERVLAIAKERGFVWREEVQFVRKDGSCYDTLLSLTPIRFRDRPCWYATVEDITDRKRSEDHRRQLEAQLRQAQKMEAVGRMTGGIAHDFNNVLSIIISNAELVAASVGTESVEASEDLAELMAAAERGAAMVRKLLGFSRHADLKLEPTDLSDLMNNLGGMLRHLVPAHIALRVTVVPGATGVVDAGAVEQIMMNLATNARDATDRGGELRIDVRPAAVTKEDASVHSWVTPGEFVCVSVADTGAGMDDATLARIFEPFFTTKAAGVGTGLGLAMVYGLVKQQQGFIRVESTVGKGTTVSLFFPRAPSAGPRPVRVRPKHGRGGHETILLLEDDEDLRRTANRVLMTLGYRVLLAADGREGLAMYRARRDEIDLVLSDIVLPYMTGPEVYDAIKRENPSVRFLLSSGYRKGDVPEIQIPIDLPLLLKPWSVETMAQKVREVLDSGGAPGVAPPGA